MRSKEDSIHQLILSAYHYLHFRARTMQEMRTYLTKKTKKNPEAFPHINKVLIFLQKEKYLDDKKFIKEYVRSRISNKPRSKYLLIKELKTKGITQEDIDEYFDTNKLDEKQLATKALTKVIGRWRGLQALKRKKRAYDYLARKGFPYDVICNAYEQVSTT